MSSNVVGIIVCIAMIVCGMGAYFIGRLHGIEWASIHLRQIVIRRIEDDSSGEDQADG